MRRTAPAAAAAMLLSVLITPVASGQQVADALRVTQQGLNYNAHALGLGNAYNTIGYDVTALSFNPATMAVSDKFSWTVSANANGFKSSTNYYDNRTPFRTSNATGGQLGVTVPFALDSMRALVIGASYTQSKDFNNGFKFGGMNLGGSFPSFVQVMARDGDPTGRALGLTFPTFDGSGNYTGDQTVLGAGLFEQGYSLGEGNLVHYSLGAALEPANDVYFGASGSYNTGHYTSDLELSASDTSNIIPVGVLTVPGNAITDGFVSTYYRSVRDKEYSGWDARFGGMYRFRNFIGLSASFKIPVSQEVRETSFISGVSRFANSQSLVAPESLAFSSYKFKPATEMTFGAMVNLWIVTGTAQATYVDYTAMTITSGLGGAPAQTAVNKRIKEELARVLNLNLGAEVRLPFTGLSARAGGIYQPSPYAADPSRFAQKAITLGAGYNSHDSMQLDLAYGYAWRGDKNLESGNVNPTEQGLGTHTFMFSMRVAL